MALTKSFVCIIARIIYHELLDKSIRRRLFPPGPAGRISNESARTSGPLLLFLLEFFELLLGALLELVQGLSLEMLHHLRKIGLAVR